MTKLTMQTTFVLAADIKGGINPLGGGAFILPVSGITLDFAPTYTHQLQITFNLDQRYCRPTLQSKNYRDLVKGRSPAGQPSGPILPIEKNQI